ncbi:hypothetical protein [Rhizosaccharibacter radicis]|uniref:Uncharacterized protein n=1 Tax=Rhizosaccharibacter radicis TaxID=2782605 RepID=A0ABT1VUC5_9PROT|nr:hypothetical protein [Acetobacteraceae bacterium KSS12]
MPIDREFAPLPARTGRRAGRLIGATALPLMLAVGACGPIGGGPPPRAGSLDSRPLPAMQAGPTSIGPAGTGPAGAAAAVGDGTMY